MIYIFVHGAWHGAWCWQKVLDKMMQLNVTVLAPDLPGHGKQRMAPADVAFAMYVQSLVKLILEQPEPVVLIGHSMAGLIISQVAELIPERIKKLIYVAAYVPNNGDSVMSLGQKASSRGISPYLEFDQKLRAIRFKADAPLNDLFYHLASEQDKQHACSLLQDQPLEPFTAQVTLSQRYLSVPKKAILCQEDKISLYCDQQAMCEGIIYDQLTLCADHSPFYSAVDEFIATIQK